MKSLIKILSLLIISFLFNIDTFGQCGCNHTISPSTGGIIFRGPTAGVKPGDVICIQAGAIERIHFIDIVGTPENPVIIKNCNGQALIGSINANSAIVFWSSKHFRLTGTGDPTVDYGIKIVGSKSGTMGVAINSLSSDAEVDHIEITNVGFAGIMAKTDPKSNCLDVSMVRPNFTMYNIELHNNYIHDIGGEGMYIGNSYYQGTTVYCGSTQYPHEVRGVKIYNNLFDNCGWESIQVGCGVDGVEIYNNRILNYGSGDINSQDGALQIGSGSSGKVYNNFIKGRADGRGGQGIVIQGIGNTYVFNNIVVNSIDESITINTKPTPLSTDIVNQSYLGGVYVINNTIVNPGKAAIADFVNAAPGNVFYNNLIVTNKSDWNKIKPYYDWKQSNNIVVPTIEAAKFVNPAIDDYRLLPGSPAINTGRDVSAFGVTFDFDNKVRPAGAQWDVGAFELGGNQKPAVSVGANQNLILPTNSTTLSGSAVDPDGAIVSYLWTKQSGPAATITNETTTTASLNNLVAGIYIFRLTATDNEGETGFAEVTVTVIDPNVNQPPVANAGGNKTITLPTNTTVLSGIGSDPDGTVITYEWTKVSGPTATLTNENTPSLTISDLVEGVYVFRLTVTDEDDDTASDDATVTVNPAAANQPPTAAAGPDRNLVLPTNSVNLNGSGSDPDGTVTTYLWTKQSGPAAILTNANTATLQLTGLVLGSYVFRLTVTDNNGATAFDEATVTVSAANQAPVANAGGNKTIQLPTNSTTLTGSGSDADGTITTYQWIKVSGPTATLTNINSAVLTVTNMMQGVYVFRLTVTDNIGATGSNDATITVQAANVAPTANSGTPQTLILPANSTTINGSGTDTDGSITAYLWEKLSGPTATLSGTTTPILVLSNMIEGSYTFRLTVTDNNGATGSATVVVTVLPASVNQSPVVSTGPNITLTLPSNSVDIVGTATDPDGTIVSFLWEKLSGPEVTISGTTTNTLSLTNLVAGVYTFRLTATDNGGASASSNVTVTVSSANQPPVVSAGSNQVLVLPTSSTTLQAVASDPDGTIASYLWILTSGPNAPILGGATTSTLAVSGLITGTYIFRITVTDNQGATAFAQVNVVVQSPANSSPVANAGPNRTIFLPTNFANLAGSGSDADGTIASYSWIQVSGVAVTLANANTATLSVSNLVEGSFLFRLTVTDNAGATGLDETTVTVLPASANQPPIADAGPNIALTLPVNSTNLIGSGSDADGTIDTYGWTKLSGPTVTISNQNTAVLSLQDLVEGVYVFRLTVTDDAGASASDDAQVVVFPSSVNQPPSVTAGNNRTITLPTNTATLTAVASDADGSITSYLWTKQIGPTATLFGENTSALTITQLLEGIYIFRVTVTDNTGASSFAEVSITVQAVGVNQPPIVNAGTDRVLFLPTNSVNLSGSASDPDGTVVTYLWNKTSGPSATLTNTSSPNLSLSNLVAGQYVFRLTATDNTGISSFDETTITVFPGTANQAPIANSGPNQTVVLPSSSALLTGTGFDTDGSIVAYAWTQVSGPSSTLENVSSPTLSVINLVEGLFQFRLTVEDNEGATGSDITQVTVVAENANLPPIANAGFDQIVNLPQTTLDIQGSALDPDGIISSVLWVKKSGPASVVLTGQNTSLLSLSNLVAGTYVFTLMVTDNLGATNSDDVKVIVIPATVNNNPVVSAGADIFIRLPVSTANLTATASDIDGSIVSYNWTKQTGPSGTLTGTSTTTLSLTNLVEGTYVFRIVVTDNLGATASDEVTVVVAPPGVNNPPQVYAGSAQTVLLPITSILLNGSASDPDGAITILEWSQQGGPSSASLSGINSTTLNVQNLVEGLYTFRLTATDNETATAFSETTVNVLAGHEAPVVFAGNDTTLVLPDNFITLTGQATPFAGFISAFSWEQMNGSDVIFYEDFPAVSLADLLPGTYIIRLTATDNFGASSFDDVSVTVKEGKSNPIGAHLVFSPNDDGVNDLWLVKNTNMIAGCPMIIFNSLGKKVFEATEYLNDWDGTDLNGQRLREGEYYFVFECGNKKTYSGALRLIR